MPRHDFGLYLLLSLAPAVGGCSAEDSRTAHNAQAMLIGMAQPDVEACLGVPMRHSEFGDTTILTWDSSSTSSGGLSLTLPGIGGLNLSGGGYCIMTTRLENGRVTAVRFSGEANATLAPNAYCAPIVRSCVRHPEPARGAIPAS